MKQFNLFCGTFHLRSLFLIPLMWWQIKLWSFPPMMNQIVTFIKLSTGSKYKCDQCHWSQKIVIMSTAYIYWCDQFHWFEKKNVTITSIDVTNSTDQKTICDLFHTSKITFVTSSMHYQKSVTNSTKTISVWIRRDLKTVE